MYGRRFHRRQLLKGAAAGAAMAVFPAPLVAQGKRPRVVIVGGGFGGVSCARALRKADPQIAVTLIEANATYTAMPQSSAVIAGLIDLKHQQFGYDRVKADGIDVVIAKVKGIDLNRRKVTLDDGGLFDYDRLVVSPGIDFQHDAIPGYDRKAAETMPAAYKDGTDVALLRRQLEAMEDGGLVVITSPVNPARCPPAPYERASLIAHYLKTQKPRSKIVILDAKDSFTIQKLFEAAWKELYPGMIEWIGLSASGALSEVDASTRTLITDFDKYRAAVANIIPPQRAGAVADLAGVADRTHWCPVDPVTFQSSLQKDIYVIGDAAIAGAMPRSASAAHSQGAICGAAIAALFAGKTAEAPTLTSSCYSLIAPDYAISQSGSYRPTDGQYTEAAPGIVVSPLGAPPSVRKDEAGRADAWFRSITAGTFG